MFKGIAVGVLSLCFLAGAVPAGAQDTIALYADFGDGAALARSGITKIGEPFDVVVVANTSESLRYVEFSMTELSMIYSGVFKYTTSALGGQTSILGDASLGEFAFGPPGCVNPGQHELVRVRYYDVDGSLPDNVVLSLRGMHNRPPYYFSFPDQMGYVDCTHDWPESNHVLTAAPWEDDTLDPLRIDGVTSTDGILVLNPRNISVANEATSLSALKARF